MVWTGRPSSLAFVVGGLVVTAPLGLIAVASALSWTRGEQIAALPLWARALLLLVLVFAAHMLVLRPVLGLYIAHHTAYAITDRRALVVCDILGGRIQELRHDRGELIAARGPRNFGKIQFGRTASSSVDVLLLGRAAIPGFYGVADLDEPLVRLSELRQSATTSPASMKR